MVLIYPTTSFVKAAKKLMKKYSSFGNDLKEFEKSLIKNPFIGTDLGGGLRKIRLSIKSKNKGKRGGARVITFIASTSEDIVHLLFVYDKSERDNIEDKELTELLESNGLNTNKTN